MPHYMDIHTVGGATADEVIGAHNLDLAYQHEYDVTAIKYWLNQEAGKLFCLFEAPSAEATECLHRRAHGLVAEKIIEVDPDLVSGFMGPAEANAGGMVVEPDRADGKLDPGIRTVMFTDIVGSTEMCSRHGDAAAMVMLEVHDRIVRAALAANSGREIKHTGDGIMAAFLSAACAVRCACQVVNGLNDEGAAESPVAVTVRIGITAGEPVEQHDDLFGSTVQLAARLCAQAEPGQILVSNVIADLCIGKNLHFRDAGEAHLKGFEQPIPTRAVELMC